MSSDGRMVRSHRCRPSEIQSKGFLLMRKIFSVFAVVLLLVTPQVQAKYCTVISCNFTYVNGNFEDGFDEWLPSPYATVADGECYGDAAILDPGDSVEREFEVDDDYVSYKIQFRAWLVNDNDNYFDELKVRVTNDDTGAYEEFTLNGLSYTNGCNNVVRNLSNNYDNADVTIKFYLGNFSIRTWQVDDVGFYASLV
jgi:hypothetical protein